MCTSHTAHRPRFLFPPPSSRRVPRGIVVSAIVAELEGAFLRPDDDASEQVYGRRITAHTIVTGTDIAIPAAGRRFVDALQTTAPRNTSQKAPTNDNNICSLCPRGRAGHARLVTAAEGGEHVHAAAPHAIRRLLRCRCHGQQGSRAALRRRDVRAHPAPLVRAAAPARAATADEPPRAGRLVSGTLHLRRRLLRSRRLHATQ